MCWLNYTLIFINAYILDLQTDYRNKFIISKPLITILPSLFNFTNSYHRINKIKIELSKLFTNIKPQLQIESPDSSLTNQV